MKITVIGMVKNAADVIETFIRANGCFADNFAIIDNNSTDNTLFILKKLKEEGYDITIYSDTENAYLQSAKMNMLISKVIKDFSPDWIVPLDDDEILTSTTTRTVREIISTWDKNDSYYAKWRIYTPTEEDDYNEICVAKRQKFHFSDSLVSQKKVIFSSSTASNENFRIVQGNHYYIGSDSIQKDQEELIISHYPVRSEEQIISKALVGWTNYLAMPNKAEGNGGHWQAIYNQYKEHFKIDIDMMWKICMMYLRSDLTLDKINVEFMPANIEESATSIKYTSKYEINPFLNYINNTEQLAVNYSSLLEKK